MKRIVITSVFMLLVLSATNAQIVGATDYTQPTSTSTEVYLPASVAIGFNCSFSYSWGYWYMRDGHDSEDYKYGRWPFAFSAYLDYFGSNSVTVSPGSIYEDTYGVCFGLAYVNRGGKVSSENSNFKLSCLSLRLSLIDRSGKDNKMKMRFGLGVDLPMSAKWQYGGREADITSWMASASPCFFSKYVSTSGLLHFGMCYDIYLTRFNNEMLPIESSFMLGMSTGIFIGWESKPIATSK